MSLIFISVTVLGSFPKAAEIFRVGYSLNFHLISQNNSSPMGTGRKKPENRNLTPQWFKYERESKNN